MVFRKSKKQVIPLLRLLLWPGHLTLQAQSCTCSHGGAAKWTLRASRDHLPRGQGAEARGGPCSQAREASRADEMCSQHPLTAEDQCERKLRWGLGLGRKLGFICRNSRP